ncbi:MAG: hypothetical protein AMXMBFR82_17930 [Candidatus Hydrogenedentota bacterium]
MYLKCMLLAVVVIAAAQSPVAPGPDVVAVPLSNGEYQFQLVDNPSRTEHMTVTTAFRVSDAVCAINGGFFDENFRAVGYYKVDGEVIVDHPSPGLSGWVCIDKDGRLSIHFKEADPDQYASVFQCGPMLVDPGGKPGIRSDDGKVADRSAILQLNDGSFVFLYHSKTTLHALSQYILAEYPTVDRAINLDGGPEAGIATKMPTLQIHENTIASKAYIVVRGKG